MIEERKFVVNGHGPENPLYYQGSREAAPPGLRVALTVLNSSACRLSLRFQQSKDGTDWENLEEFQSWGVGCQSGCVWPAPGRQVRQVFWTVPSGCAIVSFKVYDSGRSKSA